MRNDGRLSQGSRLGDIFALWMTGAQRLRHWGLDWRAVQGGAPLRQNPTGGNIYEWYEAENEGENIPSSRSIDLP